MATPKNKRRYRYGPEQRVCFQAKQPVSVGIHRMRTVVKPRCFTTRKRVPSGLGGPPFGGTACRSAASGQFKACPGGKVSAARQLGMFSGRPAGSRAAQGGRQPKAPFGFFYLPKRLIPAASAWYGPGPTATVTTYAIAGKPIHIADGLAALDEWKLLLREVKHAAAEGRWTQREVAQLTALVRGLEEAVRRAEAGKG